MSKCIYVVFRSHGYGEVETLTVTDSYALASGTAADALQERPGDRVYVDQWVDGILVETTES